MLPWSSFWDHNYFGHVLPALVPILRNDFVRGAVSGLGVINLIAGFFELVPVMTPGGRQP